MKELAILLRKFYVYFHLDPDTGVIRYIGKGQGKRAYQFYGRWGRSGKTHYFHWLKKLEKQNKLPTVQIFKDNLTENEALELEKKLILEYKQKNYPLVNLTNGGDGISGYFHNEISKKKMSKACAGRDYSHLKGRKLSEEHKMKISKTNKGRFLGGGFAKGHKLSGKKVIDLSSGIIFDSIREAANCFSIGHSCLRAMLVGQNPNKTTLKLIGDKE